jgi:hypothetical protein
MNSKKLVLLIACTFQIIGVMASLTTVSLHYKAGYDKGFTLIFILFALLNVFLFLLDIYFYYTEKSNVFMSYIMLILGLLFLLVNSFMLSNNIH